MSLLGSFVHNSLEFSLLLLFNSELSVLLVTDWDEFVKNVLEFSSLDFRLVNISLESTEVAITLSLESTVVVVILSLISLISVFEFIEHIEKTVKGFSVVELDGNGIEEGSSEFSLFNGFEFREISGSSNS